MNFTKTIAQALANKAFTNLNEERQTRIKNFVPDENIVGTVRLLANKLIEAREAEAKAAQALGNLITSSYTIYVPSKFATVDSIVNEYISQQASKETFKVPSRETLVDDFLIASLDANNADELINMVTSKYIE